MRGRVALPRPLRPIEWRVTVAMQPLTMRRDEGRTPMKERMTLRFWRVAIALSSLAALAIASGAGRRWF